MHFKRSSGILLHLTSLPGPYGNGDLGPSAYHFVDWLAVAGQSIWQMLPLGPGGLANSPYMSLSAFAGNPLVIDLAELEKRGWLNAADLKNVPSFSTGKVDFGAVIPFRFALLRKASANFAAGASAQDRKEFEEFCASEKYWLDDYAVFQALNEQNGGKLWTFWPQPQAQRDPAEMKRVRKDLAAQIAHQQFVQWCFFRQWRYLKKYANDRGVQLVGDIPIFVAHHSADVWAHRELFEVDAAGNPTVVAGVPPDYFSETGQRWGNPLYKWQQMKAKRFSWWIDRFRASLALFDIVRIDHFRGFEAYWEIPSKEKTAVKGRWVKAPGVELFTAVRKKLGSLPIIAEDLGVITKEVTALRDGFELPGMKVLQFAFAAGPENAFLPHHHIPHCVVYTGTHDNDTTVGWFRTATDREREFVRRYAGTDGKDIAWTLIRLAMQSSANMAIVPFQDVLSLDSEHRMNLPGTTDGNWEWRFDWNVVRPEHAARMYEIAALTSRTGPERLQLPAFPTGKARP